MAEQRWQESLDRGVRAVRRRARSVSRHTRARLGIAGGGWEAAPHEEHSPRVQQFVAIMSMLPAGRVLDLGSGHGKLAQICAAMGWEVTAQDVRSVRFPAEARGIRWTVGDVLDLNVAKGEYDLILCLGLLYHLDLPGQLSLLSRISHTPLLLDTHLSPPEGARNMHSALLGEVVTVDGYTGRYYREVHSKSEDERKAIPTASWGNELSFWADEQSHLRMLRKCGYAHVLSHESPHTDGRTFQLCIPKRGVRAAIDAGSPPRGPVRALTTTVRTATRAMAARS